MGFLFLFAILGCLFDNSENKHDNDHKKRCSRKKSGTWYDSLNEGDKAWLYNQYK